jgi:hypothetical protein
MPVAIEPLSSRRARIALPVRGVPQWIDFVMAGPMRQVPRPGEQLNWATPQIDGAKPVVSRWIVHNPPQAILIGKTQQGSLQNLLLSRLRAANQILLADESSISERPLQAFERRMIDGSLTELELLIADRRLPESTLATASKSKPWLIPLRQSRVADHVQIPGWQSDILQENTLASFTSDGDRSLSIDALRSPHSDLLPRILAAVAAICLAFLGAFAISENPRPRISPIAVGIVTACILWFAVESLLLTAFILILTLLWIMAPQDRRA